MRSEGYNNWFVCLSVCLLTLILAPQATRRPMSNTNGFRTTPTSSPSISSTTVQFTEGFAL